MKDVLDTAIQAARRAGEYQRDNYNDPLQYQYKSEGDPVSEIDRESENRIIEFITDRHPSHSILSEETGAVGNSSHRWIVDPLDGTSNYVRGLPDFAVSIALEVDGILQIGVVYRPLTDDLYAAARDGTTPDDGIVLSTSATDRPESSLAAISYSSSRSDRKAVWETHRRVGSEVEGIRSSGSGALDLAYLAAGKIDAVCGFDQSRWDSAAGLLLIEAADGSVTHGVVGCKSDGDFVASNGQLHSNFIKYVRGN